MHVYGNMDLFRRGIEACAAGLPPPVEEHHTSANARMLQVISAAHQNQAQLTAPEPVDMASLQLAGIDDRMIQIVFHLPNSSWVLHKRGY